MNKHILKLQIWVTADELTDEGEFRDFYFDVNKITGWFVPNDNSGMDGYEGLNLLFEGDMVTVMQEPHLLDWLTENFVKPSKINA